MLADKSHRRVTASQFNLTRPKQIGGTQICFVYYSLMETEKNTSWALYIKFIRGDKLNEVSESNLLQSLVNHMYGFSLTTCCCIIL
jgi:hypothetical protein